MKKTKFDINAIQDKIFTPKGLVYGLVTAILLFGGTFIYQSCVPKKANIIYALCSNFLELHVPFPQNIRHTDIELYRKAVRIYYIQTDSFGQNRMETIECSFFQDPQRGVQLESVLFDSVKDITESTRKKGKGRFYDVRSDVIKKFNESRSPLAILSSDTDTTVPEGARLWRY